MTSPFRYRMLDEALARDLLPDHLLRFGSRYTTSRRIRRLSGGGPAAVAAQRQSVLDRMRTGDVAEVPAVANEQHYELPPEFFGFFLGPWRKYSCCLWEPGTTWLGDAEAAMLDLTCRRAGIQPGMRVLDLGCGWGALTLWLAEREGVEVVSVSNSHSQRRHIDAACAERELTDRVTVHTCDVNELELAGGFDRIVSVEMFEHLRNWSEMLRRVASWLTDDGLAFVHVFTHRTVPYLFDGTWAAERFFTAGVMPSHDLLPAFDDDLVVRASWFLGGEHYERTLLAWLAGLDARREEAMAVLSAGSSRHGARRLLASWRLFLLGTAAMWGSDGGESWGVSHYLLERRGQPGSSGGVRAR